MELYLLDNLLRRERVIDRFESLIWTERWKEFGDFECVIESTSATRSMFNVGDRFALNESNRVMSLDTVEDKKDDEGRSMLTLTGKSLELLLEDRIASMPLVATGETPNWILTGTPGEIARQIFKRICIDGMLHPGDIIPLMGLENLYPVDTIMEPDAQVTIEIAPTTVYDAIKQVCDMYELGFRIVRMSDNGRLYFNIYSGSDRTTQQSTLPAVVFSPELDTLTNVTAFKSIDSFKNAAYVFSDKGSLMVYADNVDPTVAGFERRVLKVDATDLGDATGSALTALLRQRGLEELAAHRSLTAFDGEISETGSNKYGVHYQLGDLVEMRNTDGASNNMRVTEQIFMSDSSGERSYPTLAFDLYITPGSWRTWDYNQVWNTATKMWEQA